MEYKIVLSEEQTKRAEARKKAIEALKYNPMCYNCKKFKNSCDGEKKKLYSGCIYREVDPSKPSIYSQLMN